MNFWKRLRLKLIAADWEEYGALKYAQIARENINIYKEVNINKLLELRKTPCISFKHSGNSGDIIYALPIAFELAKNTRVNFLLHLNQPASFSSNFKHPLGRVMLNEKMAAMLRPLLLVQPKIASCDNYDNQPIDIDLDIVREAPLPLGRLCLPRWYFLAFGQSADLSKPWLQAPLDQASSEYITIARSNRYQGHKIDYSFLKKYSKIQFVGVESEYAEMKKMLPSIEFRSVTQFLEMASVICSSRLFIGNQSFPYSLAEGLKATRILEVSAACPDVSVDGSGGHQFFFQSHFEQLVTQVYDRIDL